MNIRSELFLFSILNLFISLRFSEDTDGDGFPDHWEIQNGRDPLVTDYWVAAGEKNTRAHDATRTSAADIEPHLKTLMPAV